MASSYGKLGDLIESGSSGFKDIFNKGINVVTTGKIGNKLDEPLWDTSAGKYADKPLYESIVPSRPQEYQPLDMSGFQSNVTGAGNLSNGLWNNGVGAQNPLSVGYTPTQVDTVAKAPIGAGNTPTQSSTPAPTLYASNQASNANGAPVIDMIKGLRDVRHVKDELTGFSKQEEVAKFFVSFV